MARLETVIHRPAAIAERYSRPFGTTGTDLARAVRVAGAVGILLLSDAPSYTTNRGSAPDFNTVLAISGALLIVPWLFYYVIGARRRYRQRKPADLRAQRIATVRSWQALMACVSLFVVLSSLQAPIHLSAPLAIATTVLGICLLRRLVILSLTLLGRDRAKPLSALRWLALAPCSLIGIVLGFEVDGDSWETLLLGSVAALLGPILAGCPVRSMTWRRPGALGTRRGRHRLTAIEIPRAEGQR